MKWRLLLLASCALVFLAGSLPLRAAPPWFARVWQVDDGLPGDNVTGIEQTRDGYLWIATQTGLARFDGARIKNVRIRGERPQPIIRAMCRDNADRLWLALEGGAVVRWGTSDSKVFHAAAGLPRAQPNAIVQAGDQSVWVAYTDGTICRIAEDRVSRMMEPEAAGGSVACSLTCDARGKIWLARGGQIGVFTNGAFQVLISRNERYVQVQGARDGGVWICAGDCPAFRFKERGRASAANTIHFGS